MDMNLGHITDIPVYVSPFDGSTTHPNTMDLRVGKKPGCRGNRRRIFVRANRARASISQRATRTTLDATGTAAPGSSFHIYRYSTIQGYGYLLCMYISGHLIQENVVSLQTFSHFFSRGDAETGGYRGTVRTMHTHIASRVCSGVLGAQSSLRMQYVTTGFKRLREDSDAERHSAGFRPAELPSSGVFPPFRGAHHFFTSSRFSWLFNVRTYFPLSS